jgi:hypothetical protein
MKKDERKDDEEWGVRRKKSANGRRGGKPPCGTSGTAAIGRSYHE